MATNEMMIQDVANSGGIVVLQFPQATSGYTHLLQRCTINSTSLGETTAFLYIVQQFDPNTVPMWRDVTSTGNADVADYDSAPLEVHEQQRIVIVWENVTNDVNGLKATCQAHIQYAIKANQ